MADIGVNQHFIVSPNAEVEEKWAQAAIVEKECQIKRLEADKDEIIRASVLKIEAKIMMLNREIHSLIEKLAATKIVDVETN